MNEPTAGLIQVGDVVQWCRQKRGKTVKHSGVALFFGVDCVVVENVLPAYSEEQTMAVPINRITKVY
jgi:hypothetical protein